MSYQIEHHVDAPEHIATPAEAVREWAGNVGAERADEEWILSDRDSWEPNPYYTGAPGLHPEASEADYFDFHFHGPFLPPPAAPAPDPDEDPCPF